MSDAARTAFFANGAAGAGAIAEGERFLRVMGALVEAHRAGRRFGDKISKTGSPSLFSAGSRLIAAATPCLERPMSRPGQSTAKLVAPSRRRSLWAWAGPVVVLASLACASATFLVIAFSGPIEPNSNTLLLLYFADGLAIVLLLAMVLRQSLTLWRAWRKGEAAAGLHMRTVAFFSLVALVPALAVAVVGTVSLERALSPAFMANLKGFVHKTAEAAQTFRETQCGELLKEAQLTASDLDQSRAIYDADRNLYHKYFETRARTLGFSVAALVHPNGQILDQVVGDPTAAS